MTMILLSIVATALTGNTAVAERQAMLPEFSRNVACSMIDSQDMDTTIRHEDCLRLPEKKIFPPKFVMQTEFDRETAKRLIRYTYDDRLSHSAYSIHWDEYGFPADFTRDPESNHGSQVMKYNYEWKEPGKIWSSKLVEEKDFEGATHGYLHDEIRTFHPNGSVASRTLDSRSDIGRYTVLNYDENGNLIKEANYRLADEGWSLEHLREYHYFPEADKWVDSFEDESLKVDLEIEGNGYIRTQYRKENDNELFPVFKEGRWFGDDGEIIGYMRVSYDEVTGDVKDYRGFRTKYDIDGDGNSILEEMSLDLNDECEIYWKLNKYTTYSPHFDFPWIYNPGEERIETELEIDNYERITTYTWMNPIIVKRETDYQSVYGSHLYSYHYFYIDDDCIDYNVLKFRI